MSDLDSKLECRSDTSITLFLNEGTGLNPKLEYGSVPLKLLKDKTEIICVPKAISDEVTIPNDITSIGNCAFSGCSSLTSITFNGTKAQWQAIHYFANCAVGYLHGRRNK